MTSNTARIGLRLRQRLPFGDLGLTGNAQIGFVHGSGKSLAHLVVQHFVLHGVAITLSHNAHGHLAGTEAVHLHGARHLLQAGIHFGLDRRQGHAQRDLALELFKSFNVNGHDFS
jgi:hypothetical protein